MLAPEGAAANCRRAIIALARNQDCDLRNPDQRLLRRFVFVLGTAICAAVSPIALTALADAEGLPAAPSAPSSTAEAADALMSGPEVYDAVCIACHGPPGLGGAPALGDGDAWAERIAQGIDTLIDPALRGFSGNTGIMPRKGGRLDLSDQEIIRAVEYMVAQAAR